ncbi:hypothetical protein F0U60_48550 [Archangium minus]|uniref:Uncharacterized protein n=1 Tax=Archangium minus TaxID=83450 RepID=A0ABY9X6U0_9BACT|nr:hypothetical protein F0U61_48600 [Archangium violaceum]WNG51113.1 hypothetical protein F0U60_48550 [Archangium minus]
MLTNPQRLTLIDDLVRPVWEKLCPRGDDLAWQYALTDPVPESWPARGGVLVFYAYARALNLAQPTSGEFSGPVWARIRHVLDSGESRLELLQQVINPGPRRGFRPLTGREYEILQTQPLTLLGAPLSKEGEHQLRDYFRLQLSLGNVPPEVVAAHAAFFQWVGR